MRWDRCEVVASPVGDGGAAGEEEGDIGAQGGCDGSEVRGDVVEACEASEGGGGV
jgi:hypothetical protein